MPLTLQVLSAGATKGKTLVTIRKAWEAIPRIDRSWLRFRLRTLLLWMLVLSLPLAWLGRQYNAGRQDAALIRELGGQPVRFMYWDPRWGRVIGANFQGTQISDDDLKRLRMITTLRWINIEKTPITDAGLAHLSALPNLGTVFVSDTAVTDEGLKHLGRLPNLQFLQAHRTKITSAGVDELVRNLPALDVYWTAK